MSKNRPSLPDVLPAVASDGALRMLFDRHFKIDTTLSPDLVDAAQALRYQVYCRERMFEESENFPDGRECDEYDERSVHALVRHRATGECIAAVRLVLTDTHNPLTLFPVEDHCAHALPTTAAAELAATPRSRIAEISRLAVSRELRQRMTQNDNVTGLREPPAALDPHIMPCIVLGLFSAIVRLSAKLGITHWLAVMEPTLLRLLKRYGIRFPHVGMVVNYHGRRRPAVAQASSLIDGILCARPDVWDLITDSGNILPARPLSVMPHLDQVALTLNQDFTQKRPITTSVELPTMASVGG